VTKPQIRAGTTAAACGLPRSQHSPSEADVMLPEDVGQLLDVMLCYNDTRGRKEVRIA
jgi:hypothetical protein